MASSTSSVSPAISLLLHSFIRRWERRGRRWEPSSARPPYPNSLFAFCFPHPSSSLSQSLFSVVFFVLRRATAVDGENSGKASTFLPYLVLYFHSNGDSSLPFSSLSQKCKLFLLPFKLRRPLPFSGEFPAAASLTGVGTYELK